MPIGAEPGTFGLGFAGFVLERIPWPAYLLDRRRKVVASNAHGRAGNGELDEGRRAEVAEWTRPSAAPPGVVVEVHEEKTGRWYLVRDLRGESSGSARARAFAKAHGLTGAVTEVLVLMVEGLTDREIAARRGTTFHTARTQVAAARAAAGVKRKAMLVARALGKQ